METWEYLAWAGLFLFVAAVVLGLYALWGCSPGDENGD